MIYFLFLTFSRFFSKIPLIFFGFINLPKQLISSEKKNNLVIFQFP